MRAPAIAAVFGLTATLVCGAAWAQERTARAPLSTREYAAALDRLSAAVEALDEAHPDRAANLAASVPAEWQVTAADGTSWAISGTWVRGGLDAWRRRPDAAARTALVFRLRTARDVAASYERPPLDVSPARSALAAILARPEFNDLSAPSWLDRLRARVLQWLLDLLGRLLGSSSVPTLANAAVYLLIGAAVVIVALWVRRALFRRPAPRDALLDLHLAAARPWQDWLAEAEAASVRGDWRQAIRLAYWCGIVYLEARGAWRPDPSRTPREYLRLSSAGAYAQPLGALTRLLERVWYGTDAAGPAGFEEAIAHLRTLGCPTP